MFRRTAGNTTRKRCRTDARGSSPNQMPPHVRWTDDCSRRKSRAKPSRIDQLQQLHANPNAASECCMPRSSGLRRKRSSPDAPDQTRAVFSKPCPGAASESQQRLPVECDSRRTRRPSREGRVGAHVHRTAPVLARPIRTRQGKARVPMRARPAPATTQLCRSTGTQRIGVMERGTLRRVYSSSK